MPIPKKLPETLTPTECKALVAQPKPRYPTGLRDLCMLRLMLNTGLRAAECLNLHVGHVDWMHAWRTIFSRGCQIAHRAACQRMCFLLFSWASQLHSLRCDRAHHWDLRPKKYCRMRSIGVVHSHIIYRPTRVNGQNASLECVEEGSQFPQRL